MMNKTGVGPLLDPSLHDRLVDEGSKLSLDALEYIDECHTQIIALQQMVISHQQQLAANRERTAELNNQIKVLHERSSKKVSFNYGGFRY